MAVTVKTLADVAKPFSQMKYEELFTPKKGFLVWDDGKKSWGVQNLPPNDPAKYYSELVNRLIQTKAYRELPNAEAFVRRLNICRTNSSMQTPVLKFTPTIYFNSKDTNYSFLSNFYSTLILFKDHEDPNMLRLYPSCENAYQAHKVANYIHEKELVLEEKGSEEMAEDDEKPITSNDLEMLANSSSLNSKELANRLMISSRNTDKVAQYKYDLMLSIVAKKFQDNPAIAKWLKGTGQAHLVENTNDGFWGAKNPNDQTLHKDYTLPITAASRNILGRILMDVRNRI